MDNSIQDLEFLDLGDLDDNEAQSLRSFLASEPQIQQCEQVQPGPETAGGVYEGGVQHYQNNVDHAGDGGGVHVPVSTVGYHHAGNPIAHHAYHPAMYSPNMCVTTLGPQYLGHHHQPTTVMANLAYAGLPGVFAATAGHNYYVNTPSSPPGISPGQYPQPHHHHIVNGPPGVYSTGGYQQGNKRKPGGGGRSKYSPRKELPNGHHGGDGYFAGHYSNGPYFPNNIVQAATGLPIVMHQPMPAYVPPHPTQVTAASNPVVYQHHPVVTFAQSPLPAEVVATLGVPELPVLQQQEEVVPNAVVCSPPPAPVPEKVEDEVVVVVPPAPIAPAEAASAPIDETPVVPVSSTAVPAPVMAPPEEPVAVAGAVAAVEKDDPPANGTSGAKSWASLFKKHPGPVAPTVADKPTARVEPFTTTVGVGAEGASADVNSQPKSSGPVPTSSARVPVVDVKIRRLAEHLSGYELVTTPLALLPRGLINKGNWCYINATLQALIACPPFVHLVKSLAPFAGNKGDESSTPIIDSVVDFIDQFETVPVRTGKERASAKKEEPHFGPSFEPASIYRMLSKIRSETFKVEGRQEDAEEFLSCLLNGLHDEMVEVMKTVKSSDAGGAGPSSTLLVPADVKANSANDDEDWQVIGPKNRGCVTRSTSYSKTPVSNLFLGVMRSALHAHSTHSSEFEPYFSLQLDIQNDKVNSVRDALACLVAKEPLTGYVCSKTGQEVEASRQTTFEELPAILILHLKCFVYDKSGGCQKLLKRVEFSSDLELSKDFLSPLQKGKLKERQRQYKLFAVVYHDGKEATKGHYVTEVHHTGTGNWLRFDDSLIRVVDTQLFKYSLPRMPYLLLYRKVNM